MKVVTVDRKHLVREAQIAEHPLWVREHSHVERLITAIREAQMPAQYFEVHRELLQAFCDCQRLGDSDRQQHREVRTAIRDAVAQQETEKVRYLSGLLEAVSFEIDTTEALLSVYRTLGDAMVWRLLDYDRGRIAALSEGTRVGRLSTGDGLQNELDEISWLWEERGVFALHCDLTNCVRHGDILSIEQWEPKIVQLTESKMGKAGARGRRQTDRMRRFTELANRGYHPTADRGSPLALARCDEPIRTNLAAIDALLDRAKLDTYAVSEVEDGVLVEAFDARDPADRHGEDFAARNLAEIRSRGWREEEVLRHSIQFRRLRDQRFSVGVQLPLALLPFEADKTADLLMGPLDYTLTVDTRTLQRRLSRGGTEVTVALGRAASDVFLRATNGAQRITFPSTSTDQLLVEGLSVESLRKRIEWFLEDARRRGGERNSVAVTFTKERRVWESRAACLASRAT